MKLNIINVVCFLFFSICFAPAVMAQTGKTDTLKLQDTVSVELVGRKLSKELIMLRDSINNTLESIQKSESKANVPTRDKLRKESVNLKLYQARLENDIVEVFVQTSKNGWNMALINRIKSSSGEVRREYKRIVKDVKNHLVARS